MHRTNVYLTDEQCQALDVRARSLGTTRSALLRAIVDLALVEPPAVEPRLAAAFADLAAGYESLTQGLFDDDTDLRIER